MALLTNTLFFQKSRFVTQLPVHYFYSRAHLWAEKRGDSRWRLGFTQFATRLLGEIVDYNFEVPAQAALQPGQVVGWVEGFKTITDIVSVARGVFVGANPDLQQDTELISRAPYTHGWLYEIEGQLDDQCLDVQGYAQHLNVTIGMLLEKQHPDDQPTIEPDSL